MPFPDFAQLDFDANPLPCEPGGTRDEPLSPPWETPEGVAVKPVYDAADVEGLDFTAGYPGLAPFARGP